MLTEGLRETITKKMVANYENRDYKDEEDESTEEYEKRVRKLSDDEWVCELVSMWSVLED